MPARFAVPRQRRELPAGHLVGGRYRVSHPLASGGFGTVYVATHVHTQRSVALKVLHEDVALDEVARERFRREVSAPAQIDHPGIVQVLDADVDEDGTPFVAMELLQGESLAAALERPGRDLGATVALFDRLLDGLAAAHAAGFVHRDLKPENVFVVPRAQGAPDIRILDLGLARHQDSVSVTETGTSLGTPRYMSPEQFMNAKDVGPPADVWAVGVMLYQALGGSAPFDERSSHALMLKILTELHAPLDERAPIPPPLARLVDRCLDKEPTCRPPDAAALQRELSNVTQSLGADDKATVPEMARFHTPTLDALGTAPTVPVLAHRPPPAVTAEPAPEDARPNAALVAHPVRRKAIWILPLVALLGLSALVAAAAVAWTLHEHAPAPASPAPEEAATRETPMLPLPTAPPLQPNPRPSGPGGPMIPEAPPDPTAPLEPLLEGLPLP